MLYRSGGDPREIPKLMSQDRQDKDGWEVREGEGGHQVKGSR